MLEYTSLSISFCSSRTITLSRVGYLQYENAKILNLFFFSITCMQTHISVYVCNLKVNRPLENLASNFCKMYTPCGEKKKHLQIRIC